MNTGGANRAERRLAAILAADIAGYSRLIGADEEGTLSRLRSIRAEVIDSSIATHRGRLVKTTGDGLLVEFASVVDALRCASEIQQAMTGRNAETPPAERIDFRIGINVGDVVVEDGDIFGDGVNVAARLEALADPSGICVSARVQEDAAGRLDLIFEDLGEQNLKNIARPVRAYRVVPATAEGTAKTGPIEDAPVLALPDKPSIAVLPFQNMSGDPEQEYFADGMVEEIITALSRLRWFFVIARNSTFTYKGRAVDVKQVGRELGVRYVLEGSVRKGGNRLRITVQLVEAETGNHVWAERYDRDLSDIFAVQDEITERVVAAIEPELYAAENIRSRRKPPESLDAWECVIRALSGIGQGTRESVEEAERLCRRAIAIAPSYGQAHSLLAWVLMRRATFAGDLQAIIAELRRESQTALALDDRDPWAHFARASMLVRLHRSDEAVRELRRALELNPNFALAHAYLAVALTHRSRFDEVAYNAHRALRLSPSDRNVAAFAGLALALMNIMQSDYSAAADWSRSVTEKSPQWPAGHAQLTAALALQGDAAGAAEACAALLRVRPDFSLAWMRQNLPPSGEMLQRLSEGLRKAGIPEE
jgi:adenylate cyclase